MTAPSRVSTTWVGGGGWWGEARPSSRSLRTPPGEEDEGRLLLGRWKSSSCAISTDPAGSEAGHQLAMAGLREFQLPPPSTQARSVGVPPYTPKGKSLGSPLAWAGVWGWSQCLPCLLEQRSLA